MEDPLRVESHARLAAIVESSDDAIVSKTLEGVITSWNTGARRIFGYTAEEVVGKPITILIPPDRLHEEPMILSRLRRGERVDHFETVRVTREGKLVEVSVTISPIRDGRNCIIGVSKIARDISMQKKYERALREAVASAEAANRAKDRFLSVLSHELRTPLTPVLGAISFIENHAALPAALREQIEMVRRNVETEARLVDDLLDFGRIAEGKVELFHEVTDAHASLTNAVNVLRNQIDEKRLALTTRLGAEDRFVWADPGRLQQALLNLLSNAIKFTPAGGTITITSRSENGTVRIEVADSGIGIEQDLLPRLFDAFDQGDQAIAREFGGLGLGLSIVKSLLDLHGGTIVAASEGRGRGASFVLTLPTVPAPQPPLAPDQPDAQEPGEGRRILFVEDHADTRYVMSLLLKSFGCVVTTAGSVKEAVEISDCNPFDLLVSDIGLPDGTGMDVMRHVADRHRLKGIALSGFGQDSDRLRSEEAGFSRHLVKPVNLQILQQAIEELVA